MNTSIEIDPELARKNLSIREKAGICILLVIFRMVFPAKYEHQMKASLAPLFDILEN